VRTSPGDARLIGIGTRDEDADVITDALDECRAAVVKTVRSLIETSLQYTVAQATQIPLRCNMINASRVV